MSQTTLNLVAITIFTLVMSSLLGPLLHLSPAVPAIAAFGILGVATLDALNWQGRVGTLVVDWVAGFSAEHRTRVIRHEAGHFLAAYLLEIPVVGYTLSAWEALRQGQPGQGGVSFGTAELETEWQQGKLSAQLMDRYCTVWMAGVAAEELVYGKAQGGADDRQKLRLLWGQQQSSSQSNSQFNSQSDSQRTLKERWATLQAKTLLESHQPVYEALVEAMTQRASVTDCLEVITQQINASPTASR